MSTAAVVTGRRDPVARLGELTDPGTLVLLRAPDGSGVAVATGRVDGVGIVAFATDPGVQGGAIGAAGADRVISAVRLAVEQARPVVGLWHSGGARLLDDVDSMDGVGRMFAAFTAASGVVPQISVVLGPAAGAAAYGPALTDVVVMSDAARLFVTGPAVLRSVTGEDVDMADLGGPFAHGHRSGVAHVCAADEAAAIAVARRITGLLGRPTAATAPPPGTPVVDLLPASPRRAYDVRPLLRALLDVAPDGDGHCGDGHCGDGLVELQPDWAPNIVVGWGRLDGRTVGVVANNPIRKGGCLDAAAAEKAARFVRVCDCFGVPLLVVVDVPGYLPGVEEEWNGVVRRGAKLLHAFAECSVARLTLITRKAYGGAYIAMSSRALGASRVLAWPGAEIAVMGPEAAVEVLHRRTLADADPGERAAVRAGLAQQHRRESGGLQRAVATGIVDEIVAPERTRDALVAALHATPTGRGTHRNIPL